MLFNLFKSKPTLKELIPEGFVDIHSHILPDVDDGPKNIEESLRLISSMKKLGFSKITATPHFYPGVYNNDEKFIMSNFKNIFEKEKVHIEISYAGEYMIDASLIKKAEKKELLCLKENLVLVETSYIAPPKNFLDIIFQIRINDYRPVLAHPERYRYLFNNLDFYKKLKDQNCLFQTNLLSCTGYYGQDVAGMTDILINKNYIDFVGSDIHSEKHVKSFENKILCKNTNEIEELIYNTKTFFK